ncbi:uncharacterized protein LOC127261270 [Andrographis paniculata]|uniref:uncharacterized protein LOC127261270 n=1 Tax=Andrographis paniculata TaxID=175694 RepID=UPI0021E88577|nr:uncharacterized protein LOC127261270 [Andrographis paniculata]
MSTMELSPLMMAFCVAVLALLPHCSSYQTNAQKTVRQYGNNPSVQPSHPLLPRKLNLQEVMNSYGGKTIEPHRKMMEAPSGKKQENVMQMGKGREEGSKESEYLSSMDYVWVKRRRPIHNKQAPVLP